MIALELRFPAGRYHATPPDHHANEGLVEWPPSPWRLARALLATGFRALGWPTDAPPAIARRLLARLAEAPPSYLLPPRPSVGELRTWAPVGDRRALLVDGFCLLGRDDRVVITWPATPPPDELALLDALLERLPYLGRAESWVRARRVDPHPRPEEIAIAPADPQRPTPDGAVPLELLAPLSDRGLAAWRGAAIDDARAHDPGSARRIAERLRRIDALYPRDVTSALLIGSDRILRERWSAPPGSHRIAYDLPAAAIPRATPGRATDAPRLGALRATTSLYFRLRPHPPACAALGIGERVHARVARAARADQLDVRARLLGLDALGRPLTGHRHLHLVPHRAGARLVGLLAYVPAGWTPETQALIESAVRGDRAPPPVELLGPARVWRTASPFLCPRHPRRDRERPEDQLRSALRQSGQPEPTEVRVWSSEEVRRAGLFAFSRSRAKPGRAAPLPRPYGFTVAFEAPIEGPFAVGYGAHLGLGALAAVLDEPEKAK